MKKDDESKQKTDPFAALKQRQMLQFSTGVLANREFQYLGRSMLSANLPLRNSYMHGVDVFFKDLTAISHWQACRSAEQWQSDVVDILSTLTSFATLQKCGIASRRTASRTSQLVASIIRSDCDDEHPMALQAAALVDLVVAT